MADEAVVIRCAEDCGNAPKKALIRDFIAAAACGDRDAILKSVSGDIRWEIVGDRRTEGAEEFVQAGLTANHERITEVQIHNVLTHGSTGAANGTVRTDRGTFAFCDVYRFNSAKNAKIAEMMTYRIRL